MMDAQESRRARLGLLARLWRERQLGEDDGEPEMADVPTVDLRTLLSEMAALRSEVRAETRAARDTRDQLGEALSQLDEQLERSRAREALLQEAAERAKGEASRATARALIDLADRLEPALAAARAAETRSRRWFERRAQAGPSAHSLIAGIELTLEKLSGHLSDCGVERIPTVGLPFDPTLMQALDTACEPGMADGAVVREVLAGYRDRRGLVRPAQVVVNQQRARPGKEEP